MVNEIYKQGIVQPSVSPWASPIVLVPKTSFLGTKTMGHIVFALISVALMTWPTKMFIAHQQYYWHPWFFSSLDLASGYWQVELDPDSRQKSAFYHLMWLVRVCVHAFGLSNVPATFQCLMQKVLAGLEWRTCFIYLDDILVASHSFDEHLHEVFTWLRDAGLHLKPCTCSLLQEKVPFLSHIVSTEGVRPDPVKIEKVQCYPTWSMTRIQTLSEL